VLLLITEWGGQRYAWGAPMIVALATVEVVGAAPGGPGVRRRG
jgi:hypothetical protein